MPKLPYMQFYVNDWFSDFNLAKCSLASRGCWMELLCAMHNLNRSGVITGTADQLSRICRCSAVEFVQCVNELQAERVGEITVRDGIYTIVNRRMRREAKEREQAGIRMERHQNGRETAQSINQNDDKTENKRNKNGGESDTESKKKDTDVSKEKFRAPTIEEVKTYCLERRNGVDPVQFVNHYQAKGWKIGKSPMKDWKAAVRTWEKHGDARSENNGGLLGIRI